MKIFTPLFILFLMVSSCSVTENSSYHTKRIAVASGPEDMVLDSYGGTPRLLISCSARRGGDAPFGEILSFTPLTGEVDTLQRIGTPDSLYFQPHGIFLDSLSYPPMLYAISHEHDQGFHPVYLYEVHSDTLIFKELAFSSLVHSPNALTLGEGGEIYIVNDAGKRGSLMEKILKLNRADIVCLGKLSDNHWEGSVVAKKLGYPAGINRLGKTLYAGDAVNNLIHVYTIEDDKLIPALKIKDLKGNDNIRICDGMIYITGHVKPFKFISHIKSSENLSPVEVWEINPVNNSVKSIFYTDGSLISAGSTAILLNGKLYISQVFDPFILEVETVSKVRIKK